MKFIILLGFIALAFAAPPPTAPDIINSYNHRDVDGSYQFGYETKDGLKFEEIGTVIDAGKDTESIDVKGTYQYKDTNGDPVDVTYSSGKGGFVPYGNIVNEGISNSARLLSDN